MSQMHCTQPTMYKFFCFKIKIKIKADSYMPCKAMAHSTKSHQVSMHAHTTRLCANHKNPPFAYSNDQKNIFANSIPMNI
jgi:hypothetical protein